MNKEKIRSGINKTTNFLKQKKVTNVIIILIFLTVLIWGSSIRLQNLPLLIDQTSGEYIPLALDPFYFLRVAETIVDNGGVLPTIDSMRYPSLGIPFTNELTPRAVVFMYQTANLFGDYSLRYIDVISPVIFFALGLIVFFFLVYVLTNSKGIALLSSSFLAFVPPYLYRTMAGFSDHEAIGMFAFFSVMLIYVLAIKYLEKERVGIIKVSLLAIVTAFLTIITLVSWGGVGAFVFMIIPFSFLLIWIIKFKKENETKLSQYLSFYITWVVFTFIFGFIFNYSFSVILGRFTNSSGIIGAFVFGFIIVDSILYLIITKGSLVKETLKKYRVIFSVLGTIVLGTLLLFLAGKNIFQIILSIWAVLMQPFGTERIVLTVAENAQPFLVDWIGQIGSILFWMSFFGMVIIGVELGKKILSKKGKITFSIIWILLISGILFSKYAPGSIFNGDNFISKGIYLLGVIIFLIYGIKIYLEDEIKLDSTLIVLASFMLISVISVKSASRIFFLIVPFACISASFLIFKIKDYTKNNKDELKKWLSVILLILLIAGSLQVLYKSYNIIDVQATYTGPSANAQWQQAMSWARDNTPKESVFVHWWDYGYWVQYLGERSTITDGGHGNAFWDHLIGRYLLTSPSPKAALSFMKAQDVSYLLIDQTDLGKYPAYSKIAGDEDYDSFSIISLGVVDHRQTTETADTITRIYNIGGIVDEDIIFKSNGKETFIPGPSYNEIGQADFKAYIIAIRTSIVNQEFQQPEGIFIYGNEQITIPLRYLYFQGKIIDFESGLDSIAYLFDQVNQNSNRVNVDPYGAVIYLSPKVSKSLFAQLYLLNDVFGNYPTIKLAHNELDVVVQSLRSQGVRIGDFVYFNGFRGSIKIWEINYPSNIIIHEEFTRTSGEYAEFDYLM